MKTTLLKVAVLSLMVNSCEMYHSNAQYSYQYPDSLSDGFDVGTLEEVNMNTGLMEEAVSEILGGRFPEVHSMLIYKDGKLVLDEYFPGHKYKWDAPMHHGESVNWDKENIHNMMSSSKSVTSSLIGIALDHGFIESVHQSIFDFLPEHQDLKSGGKELITIEHLLTMTSGLEWKEWSAPYSSVENPCIGVWFAEKDPITFILEMPLVSTPGNSFNYSTGHMHLLGEILRNASGLDIVEFSNKYLFEPLAIDTSSWSLQFPNGVYDGNSLKLAPRDMMKFGVTFLNKGVWDGQTIVPGKWVRKCEVPYQGNRDIKVPGNSAGKMGYSYTWWTREYYKRGKLINMFAAEGWGGQSIMVFPEVNTVVVFTGGNYVSKTPQYKILEKYIIPAL